MSEWLTEENSFGGVRRYRMVGNIKEFEAMVQTTSGLVPESQLEEHNAHQRELAEARRREEQKKKPYNKSCPLREGLNTVCMEERCTMYDPEAGCALAWVGAKKPSVDRLGGVCPFNRYGSPCRETCAMYNGGCAFTAR